MAQAKCPVCRQTAEIDASSEGVAKYTCGQCGVFRIDEAYIRVFASLCQEERDVLLGRALRGAKAGALPLISGN